MNRGLNFDNESHCFECKSVKEENELLRTRLKKEQIKRRLLLEAYEKLVIAFKDAVSLSNNESRASAFENVDRISSNSSINSSNSSEFVLPGIPNMNENLSSNPEKNQSFTILPPTSPNEHGKENNEHNNLSSTPTLPAVLPKIRGTPHTPQPILFEDKQGFPVVRKNFESIMRINSIGSLNVKKNPVRRPQLLDSLNLEMSAKEDDSVKNQDGEKPWYFVDIDGDAKLRSWPKPSSFLAANNADFIRRSEERQRLIQDASKRRALVSSYRRAVAHDVINGNVELTDAIEVLTIDPTKICAFPKEEIIRETKRKVQSSHAYREMLEKKKRQTEIAANRLIAHCFNMSHFEKVRMPPKSKHVSNIAERTEKLHYNHSSRF
uniref:Uncharacterized protein n=1 Tax=Acrobeloides nanus TaxID=290746 RepID=A0A914CIX1_9BILA